MEKAALPSSSSVEFYLELWWLFTADWLMHYLNNFSKEKVVVVSRVINS